MAKIAQKLALSCLILEIFIASACDETCNAIIHGELTSDGRPLHIHKTYANDTHPAIISCWAKYLDSSPDARYHPVLRLLITKQEKYVLFPSMPADSEDLYNIVFNRTQPDSYYDHGFEYTIYMYDECMDYTVATCGIKYHVHPFIANQTECWSSTFMVIRYDSMMDSCSISENETTTATLPDIATTGGTMVTDQTMTTDPVTTTERYQTMSLDESEIPTTTIIPATPLSPTPSSPTATLASVSLISGIGTGTFILVLLLIVLLLVIGILRMKLHTKSADMKVLQATCDELSTRVNEMAVKDLEGEQTKDESPNTN